MTADNSKALSIITSALSLPGVKVNRTAFLLETLKVVSPEEQRLLLEKGPISSGLFTQSEIKKIAESICSKKTLASTGTSFLAGIPGGLALIGTVPADTAQFFGFILRLAQEVAYLYGANDLWGDNDELIEERVKSELMIFLAVMFGVAGANSLLRIMFQNISKNVGKQLVQKALTKTAWYPIIKTLAQYLGVKMTKDTFARTAAKVVPILGGVVSGSLTYVTMTNMTKRLIEEFDKGVDYTEKEKQSDIETLKEEMPDIYEAIFEEIE